MIYPPCQSGTRLSLNGPIVVARDIVHAKLKERLDNGEAMPAYMKDHIVYYAGPAKTPDQMPVVRSGQPPAGAWTAMSTLSRPLAVA